MALYTFGMFAEPAEDAANDGFHHLNDMVLASVDRAEGLVARSGYASDPGPASWGPEVYPRFYTERGDGWSPATLSLWTDLEAAFAFTYSGLHVAAVKRGREWFVKPAWPPLAMWWHAGPDHPTWAEAVRRHEHLHDAGPTPTAFTFKAPFDESGAPMKLDQARIRALRLAQA
nr:DUF3291 domain-containing protein [Pararhodobacter sp. SW119]